MPFGIAGEGNLAQTVTLDQAGCQQVVGVGEWTHRIIGVATDDQCGPYIRLGRRTLKEVVRLREARRAAAPRYAAPD